MSSHVEMGGDVTGSQSRANTVNVVVSVLFPTGHAALMSCSQMMSFTIAMSTDACAYQDCGDEAWVNHALNVVLPVGGLLFFDRSRCLDRALGQGRRAWFVPVAGCLTHVVFLLMAFKMVSLAGPLGG
jgi:hypothetical protein